VTYDYVDDSPDIGDYYCPDCDPARDPFEVSEAGRVLLVRYCFRHLPMLPPGQVGAEGVPGEVVYLSGSGDAGGETNRAVCDGIHRGKWPA
jgi:hypothetical protein